MQGASLVMWLDDDYLKKNLGYDTVKAAQRRRERGDFPATTTIGGRVAVLLPDLAEWLCRKSVLGSAPEHTPPASPQDATIPSARRRGRPRLHAGSACPGSRDGGQA